MRLIIDEMAKVNWELFDINKWQIIASIVSDFIFTYI